MKSLYCADSGCRSSADAGACGAELFDVSSLLRAGFGWGKARGGAPLPLFSAFSLCNAFRADATKQRFSSVRQEFWKGARATGGCTATDAACANCVGPCSPDTSSSIIVSGLQAIIALLSGVVLLMTFIYIFSSFLSAGGKKKKKGASGSVMKVEDGKEVRRSTR